MISNLVRKAIKPTDDFSAYCFFYNGVFEQMLASVPGVTLYGNAHKSYAPWKKYFSNDSDRVRQLMLDQVPFNDISFDAVLCNHRISQHGDAKRAAMYLNVPLIVIDHIGPDKSYGPLDIEVVKTAYKANHSIVTNNAASRWAVGDTIPYFVDIPQEEEPYRINDYIICGDFKPADFIVVREITENLKSKYRIIGAVQGFDTQIIHMYEELEEAFLQSKVYIHLPTSNTITYELLLAMACGCGIVSARTEAVESILKDGENCVIVKDIEDVAPMARALASNESDLKKYTEANFALLKKEFSRENFVNKWQDKIHTIKRELFVP
jgi:hypothetical protein